MPTPSAPAPQFENTPDDFWALNHPTAKRLALNNGAGRDKFANVSAHSCRSNTGPAYVFLSINGPGFDVHGGYTTESARALGAALIEASDLCDTFEAAQTIAEERETARLNAGPIARIELPGGVVAFETEEAGEVRS